VCRVARRDDELERNVKGANRRFIDSIGFKRRRKIKKEKKIDLNFNLL
jgi:hypothetical protein